MGFKANLFIVGAPKAGTTSLHQYLNSHPEISMSRIKEPNYFSATEISDLYYDTAPVTDPEEYARLFLPSVKFCGEASVSYLYYEDIAQRLADYNPDAKIIIILRNPVKRAISHFLMDTRLGYCNVSLGDIMQSPEMFPKYFRQFILLGNYALQVKRYLDVFDDDAVKVMLYDDLKASPKLFMAEIFSFLGLSEIDINYSIENRAFSPRKGLVSALYKSSKIREFVKAQMPGDFQQHIKKIFVTKKSSALGVSDDLHQLLKDYFEHDIKKTGELVGEDLSTWVK